MLVQKRVVHLPRSVVAAFVSIFSLTVVGASSTYAGSTPPNLPIVTTVRVGRFPTALAVDEQLGRVFVVNTMSRTMSELDAVQGTVLRTIPLVPQQDLIAVDSRNHHVFISSYDGTGDVLLLDAVSGIVAHVSAVAMHPHVIVVDQRTQRVFVTTQDSVSMLDAVNGSIVRTVHLKSDGEPGPATVDEQRGHVFIDAGTSIYMLDARTAAVLGRAKVGSYTTAVVAAPQAGHVFVTDQQGAYSMLDARTGSVLRVVHGTPSLSGATVDDTTGRIFVTASGGYGLIDARCQGR